MKRDRWSVNGLVRFAAYAGMVVLCAGMARGQSVAPVNPAFRKWQKEQTLRFNESYSAKVRQRHRLLSANGIEGINYGISPDVVDMSYLANINSGTVRDVQGGFPSFYDQRTNGFTTPVKNQNPYGTCWVHATFGSLETWLKKAEGLTFDFSENNLANLHGFDDFGNKGFNRGGNGNMASAYLLRWDGPVLESDDPYPSIGTSSKIAPARHVQNVRWIAPRTYYLDNDAIKAAVMSYGGVWVAYYHDFNQAYFNEGTASYYFNGNKSRSINHAVTIVGWNDDYPAWKFGTLPPGNGAFIVKNSWGTEFGENGYFYVSYYDESFAWTTSYVFCNAEPVENYNDIYQYDPLGFVNMVGYNSISAWGAGIFTARANASLAAVGFYSLVPDTAYTLKVYTGCTAGSPTSGTLATTQQGIVDYAGFVTIPLSGRVTLASRQRFSVVVRLTTPGCECPLAFEYAIDGSTSEAVANSGETFLSYDGLTWADFTSVKGSASFCVKAYTSSAVEVKPVLSSIAISGVSSLTSGQSAQFSCKAIYSDGSRKDVSPSWNVTDGRNFATVSSTGLVTAKSVTEQQRATVWASYTEEGVTKDAAWSFYVTTAAPSAPTGVTATQGTEASCVRVNWTAPSGATEYAVYRAAADNSKNAQYLGNVTVARYNDTSARPGVDYWYFIKAKNSSGTSGFSASANGWRKLAPPDNVTATDTPGDVVRITWDEMPGAYSYCVYRSAGLNDTPVAISGWQTGRSFDDATAERDVLYLYYVKAAMDSSGTRASDFSVFDEGVRPSPPKPEELTVNGASVIPSGESSVYSATATYSNGAKKLVTPSSWSIVDGEEYATVSQGSVSAAVVKENHTITLSASYGETVEGVRVEVTGERQITIAAKRPSAPTGLSVLSTSAEGGVRLGWGSVLDASSYAVYRKVGNSAAIRVGLTDELSFEDTSATPGITYVYSVAALNGAGEGYASVGLSVAIPLAVPSGMTATTNRTDGVQLAWNVVPGATHYRVARSTYSGGAKTELGTWQNGTTFLDTTGVAGTTYLYYARAATGSGGANATEWSASAQGVKKEPVSLISLAIRGQGRLAAGSSAAYSCVATYSDGSTKAVSPDWSVSDTSIASIDDSGMLDAGDVASSTLVTITASYSDGVTRTATWNVKIVATSGASSLVEVTNVVASSRWPFAAVVDVDYMVSAEPPTARGAVAVTGYDFMRDRTLVATTLSGDGANGGLVGVGAHRISWNIGEDYPDFHTTEFVVDVTAISSAIESPSNVSAVESTSAVNLSWNAVDGAQQYEVWRGTTDNPDNAQAIQTLQGSTSTSFADTTAVPGVTYRYWIVAIDQDGNASEFGEPVTGTRTLLVPTGLSISGADSVEAGDVVQYSCTATYNDGTSAPVAASWSITAGTDYAAIDEHGVLTAGRVTATQNVTILAGYSLNGTSVSMAKAVRVEPKRVTISFNGNGGLASQSSATYVAGMAYGTLPTASRTGYRFAGWVTENDIMVVASDAAGEDSQTLYAWWISEIEPTWTISNGILTMVELNGATDIKIPDTVTKIGKRTGWASVFGSDRAVKSVVIPRGMSDVSDNSFYGTGIEKVIWHLGVTNISSSAFYSCMNLTSVQLPSSLKAIGNNAFGAGGLTAADIPYGVEELGTGAFSGCASLASVSIPSSVRRIGNAAFSNTALTTVTIPEGVEHLGTTVFYGCRLLTGLSIPASVTSIGGGLTSRCNLVDGIAVDPGNAVYLSHNGVVYNRAMTTLVCAPGGLVSLSIPSGVLTIGDRALYHCESLAAVSLPDGVTSVGEYAFGGCGALTSITIPASVTSLGYAVFADCNGLASVTILGALDNYDCSPYGILGYPSAVTYVTQRWTGPTDSWGHSTVVVQ